MTSPLPSITPTPPQSGTGDLGWLLVNFLQEVPGTQAAVLGTLDGLPQASAGLAADQAAHLAAIATTLHSSILTAGNITLPSDEITDLPGGDVELAMGTLAHRHVIVMNSRQGKATDTGVAATLLTVLAAPDADTRMVGSEITKLVTSVVRHLGAKTRTGTANSSSAGTGTGTGAGGSR